MELLHRMRHEQTEIRHALEYFESELQAFEEDGSADLEYMRDNLAWLTQHPLQQHAHDEHALCRALAGHNGEARHMADAMQGATDNLTETAETLLEELEDMAEDVLVPKDRFDALARQFVAECMNQLEREENELYPLAEAVLSDDEWRQLDHTGNATAGLHSAAVRNIGTA